MIQMLDFMLKICSLVPLAGQTCPLGMPSLPPDFENAKLYLLVTAMTLDIELANVASKFSQCNGDLVCSLDAIVAAYELLMSRPNLIEYLDGSGIGGMLTAGILLELKKFANVWQMGIVAGKLLLYAFTPTGGVVTFTAR